MSDYVLFVAAAQLSCWLLEGVGFNNPFYRRLLHVFKKTFASVKKMRNKVVQ
jgi:hypothetical protein